VDSKLIQALTDAAWRRLAAASSLAGMSKQWLSDRPELRNGTAVQRWFDALTEAEQAQKGGPENQRELYKKLYADQPFSHGGVNSPTAHEATEEILARTLRAATFEYAEVMSELPLDVLHEHFVSMLDERFRRGMRHYTETDIRRSIKSKLLGSWPSQWPILIGDAIDAMAKRIQNIPKVGSELTAAIEWESRRWNNVDAAWSRVVTPAELCRAFGVSDFRTVKSMDIELKELTSKTYLIALADVPESHREKFRDRAKLQ
jgi:hypothetical protein